MQNQSETERSQTSTGKMRLGSRCWLTDEDELDRKCNHTREDEPDWWSKEGASEGPKTTAVKCQPCRKNQICWRRTIDYWRIWLAHKLEKMEMEKIWIWRTSEEPDLNPTNSYDDGDNGIYHDGEQQIASEKELFSDVIFLEMSSMRTNLDTPCTNQTGVTVWRWQKDQSR